MVEGIASQVYLVGVAVLVGVYVCALSLSSNGSDFTNFFVAFHPIVERNSK